MKKFLRILLFVIMFASITKIKAQELNYSEWSTLYPSGLDESFVESEVRYKWYKVENNLLVYTDEYYAQKDGYTKDPVTKTTFYRYITNLSLIFNAQNELVDNTDYCKKNFCYIKKFVTPTMVDMSEKDINETTYENTSMYQLNSEVSPQTGDMVVYSMIAFMVSLLSILFIVVKKRRKMSNE